MNDAPSVERPGHARLLTASPALGLALAALAGLAGSLASETIDPAAGGG